MVSASYSCSLPILIFAPREGTKRQRVVISDVISALIICKQLFCEKEALFRGSVYIYVFFFIWKGMSELAVFSTNGEQMMDG